MASFLLAVSLLWTAVWWFAAWSHIPLFSEYSFFPLWLGYILSVNAFSEFFFRDSLLKRMGYDFVWLFVISVPAWWFFEFLNSFVHNWQYLYRPISSLHFVLQSSIDFSSVVPAVLSTSFLFYYLFKRYTLHSRPFAVTNKSLLFVVCLGAISFCVMPFFPNQTFPLVWIAPLLIIDPLNYKFGFPSVLAYIKNGSWKLPIAVMIGSLCTGFWWEMWNFWSYPKWIYTIPYLGFGKIFEMPILGFGGYLFFGLIIWSYSVLVFSIAKMPLPLTQK